jgi:hypothetical protein
MNSRGCGFGMRIPRGSEHDHSRNLTLPNPLHIIPLHLRPPPWRLAGNANGLAGACGELG